MKEDDEQALKRGAEAGWALGMALREVCPTRTEVALKAAIAALTLILAGPADAHCYSRWYYPWKQSGCGRHEFRHRAPDRSGYVEIVPPLSWHLDWEREQAIERLKAQLQ